MDFAGPSVLAPVMTKIVAQWLDNREFVAIMLPLELWWIKPLNKDFIGRPRAVKNAEDIIRKFNHIPVREEFRRYHSEVQPHPAEYDICILFD